MIRRNPKLWALPALSLGFALMLAGACKKSVQTSQTTSLGSDSTAASAPVSPAAGAPASTAPGAVRVVDVELGKSLRADKTVENTTDTFSPKDTIFAAVKTDGSGTATVAAKWTDKNGNVVKTDERTINPTGPAVTEFSIQKPDGWPAGDYKVEVTISGSTEAVSKGFKVV